MTEAAPRAPGIGVVEAWQVARRRCSEACFTYHGPWKVFCRANVKGQPSWHRGFYAAAAARIAGGRPLRVLVCGAADEAMLRTVEELFQPLVAVVVLDQCATPLELCRRYGRGRGLDDVLRLEQARVQEAELDAGSFDVVISDGLFSFMGDAGERDRIVERIHHWLTPGGALVYSTRVTQNAAPLEYDLLGRIVQALTALTWPSSVRRRLRLARRQLRRPARTSPFAAATQVRDAFGRFAHVEVAVDSSPPNAALRIHPNFLRGRGSKCVRILALK